jgi:hypothetical protein
MKAATEVVMRKTPLPCCSIAGMACFAVQKTLFTFTFMILSHDRVVKLRDLALAPDTGVAVDAVDDVRIRSSALKSTIAFTLSSSRDIGVDESARRVRRRGVRPRALLTAVLLVRGAMTTLRAPSAAKCRRAGLADSGGASGDENDFVLEVHKILLPGQVFLVVFELHEFDHGPVLEDEGDGEIRRRFEGLEDAPPRPAIAAGDVVDPIGDVRHDRAPVR